MLRRTAPGARLAALLAISGMFLFLAATTGRAATPASGAVGPTSGSTAKWTFAPVVGAGSGGTPIEQVCQNPQCDRFALTVKLPQPAATFYTQHSAVLKIHYAWTSSTPTDLDVFAFDPAGNEVAGPGKPDTSNSGPNYEDLTILNPVSGVWSIRGDAGTAATPTPATGLATFLVGPGPQRQPPLTLTASSARFDNYDFPVSYQTRDGAQRPNAGEPSIGADWQTGSVMYMAGTQVTRLAFNDRFRPARASFTDVTPAWMRLLSEDSILNVDRQLHRTWALDFDLAGSETSFSDDSGKSWSPRFSICANAQCMPDHETLGSGPFHSPAPTHSWPHAVYYCAQQIVTDAYCGLSTDGGMTYGPGQPLWHGRCAPIHGHVRVGPTGVAYVPNDSCTDAHGKPRSGVSVTQDNGRTWVVHVIPDSSAGGSDPSVAEGPDGSVYFGYQATDGHPMIAVSHDHGQTWSPSIDVGKFSGAGTEDGMPYGVQNTEFSEVITGDPGRAAFAFLGTGKQGDDQSASFTGTWYLFVSFTYDGGRTWHTVNATPNDPVQRGCVWNTGGSNPCRNMLDFNDITIDKTGRVLVAYTDGCTTTSAYSCDRTKRIDSSGCLPSQLRAPTSSSTCTFARLSAVVRQSCGKGLIAAYDTVLQAACSTTPSTAGGSAPTAGSSGSSGSSAAASAATGSLARTGSSPLLPLLGCLLLACGVVAGQALRRWRRAD